MTDRDELLRQIGERVVERVDEEGLVSRAGIGNDRVCPTCKAWNHRYPTEKRGVDHSDDCPMTRYLEATDGG